MRITARVDSSRRASPLIDDATVVDALPPIDALPPRDADQTDCPDADATLVYVVTDQNELFSFFPPSGTFKQIGRLVCPAPDGTTPFSMAVDRQGVAYVVFNDGRLYRVSTATAACVSTSFRVGQQGFSTFGMGFATDQAGPTERLFIAGDGRGGAARGLANKEIAARLGVSVRTVENLLARVYRTLGISGRSGLC